MIQSNRIENIITEQEETSLAWQSSLALQVEADDACTAMRLGERMGNHVWGISSNFNTARNAMGAVLYSKAGASRNKKIFKYKSKRNTNRKAKYKPIFIRYCVGFFSIGIKTYGARAPPLHDFFTERNHGGERYVK